MKEKLAIVGTGIAGMASAYFLKEKYDITVFEKNDYIGGHTNTVNAKEDGKDIPIDTGFMVFNHETYPYLTKLFEKLDVPIKDTDMSFAVRHDQSGWEYNGSSISGLFSQRKNIFNPKFIKFLLTIDKFNSTAPEKLKTGQLDKLTIKEYVESENFTADFYEKFLVPMSAAVWSTPFEKMADFPAKTLIQFFYNHGFMGLDTQFQWKTVVKGSETYKQKLINSFRDKIKVNSEIIAAQVNNEGKVILNDKNGNSYVYDKVVFASHGDETYKILKKPTELQAELLSKFRYQENIAIMHTDESVMPKTKRAWSSWNYIIPKGSDPFTVYYMNMLQGVSDKVNYFININGEKYVDKSKVLKRIVYHHPLFDFPATKAQKRLQELNRSEDPMFFCGSYFRYGFHEDALMSAVELSEYLLGEKVL
jgi:predicted NAD/FAD-binding protein